MSPQRRCVDEPHHRRVGPRHGAQVACSCIVVWRLDRAFRSALDGATTLSHLRAEGCGMRSLQEPWIDTTAPVGEAMFHIMIAWARLEKQTLAELTRAGMGARSGRGGAGRPAAVATVGL